MIGKKMKFRSGYESTLDYVYRGDNHEHEVVLVRHLGGNIFSGDPLARNEQGQVTDVDVSDINAELETQESLHKGKGEKLCGHYVISLAPGETLTESQWMFAVALYMTAMGYGNSTKWTAAIHNDGFCQHVHIVTSRVKNEPGGPLVSDSNDYERGFSTMRHLEDVFDLQPLESPDNNWGKELTKRQVKAGVDRNAEDSEVDDATIIRRRFNDIWKAGKPKTVPKLIKALDKRGIETQIKSDKEGNPYGINYRVKGRPAWISGSRVKKTRTTWNKLISEKGEGISYKPWRDNPALGLPPKEKPADEGADGFCAFVRITAFQHKRLKLSKSRRPVYRDRKGLIVRLDFNCMLTPHKRRELALARQMQAMMKAMSEVIKVIMEALFGKTNYVGVYDDEWLMPEKWKPVDQVCSVHAFGVNEASDGAGFDDLKDEVDQDTKWRKRGGGGWTESENGVIGICA